MQDIAKQITEDITSYLKTPRWYNAVTLEERLASPLHGELTCALDEQAISAQALKKLLRWKEQAPFEKDSFFAERLTMDKITERELLALLDEPIEVLQERMSQTSLPNWLVELVHNIETDSSIEAIAHMFKGTEGVPDVYAILQPFYPLLQSSVERFQQGISALREQYRYLPFDPDTLLALLLPNLARQLTPKLSRTVVLELNIARLRGQLQGSTPKERYRYYLKHLSQPENLQTFLEEYSILARQLMVTMKLWVDCNLEFARALSTDWEQILETFEPEQEPGILTEVAGGAGDTHRNGHSVMILTFHSGWQLVYKPRSLSVDQHFQELLTWLNARGDHPAFRIVKIIDRATYGWMEFVRDRECTSEEEVRRFYERQGGYLALLYALDAVDFHAENVIAAGEHPLLIDLEALFHSRVKVEYAADLKRPAQETMTHSVMQIALLPQRFWSNDEFEGIDMSGLGKTEGQLSPRPVPQWESMGTDEMKLVREHVKMSGNKNCPKFRGQNVQALDYIESIVTGFTAMYWLLVKCRDEFAVEMLPRFACDEVRFIARATRTYAMLLSESFHPNILRDALKRERFFDRLWIAIEHQPYLQRLIPAERLDLFRGDIPLFTTYPNSRDLFTSQGECISAFFSEPSIEVVRKRLYQLGEVDLHRQIWMIRAAFTSTPMEIMPASPSTLPSHTLLPLVNRERLLAEASAIGDRLCEIALQDGDAADWIGLTFFQEREWSIAPAGIDLYSGLPGIILFLSYIGENTGKKRYTRYAKEALKPLRVMITNSVLSSGQINIGAFNGIGSCIYLFSQLAKLWNDPSFLQEAEALVQFLPEWIAKDDQFDIMDGSAGCIVSLLSLYAVSPSPLLLAMAIQCGDHLLASAQSMENGIGWKTLRQQTPLTGFSHGAAGIAYSLLKLAAACGEERFRNAACEALTYERSLFSTELHNWLDLRRNAQKQSKQPAADEGQASRGALSWSHGAPGIALARLASLRYMDDEITRQEIEIALTVLLEEGIGYHHEHIGPNHALAHGDFGNLETLLVATQVLDVAHLHAAREHIVAQLLESINRCGWVMGVPLNVETPGLMTGLAGIGYELLRLATPERVPSVLLLAPPSGRI
jgi:type 2 lantibiotic biosynthesis protein LanM